MQVIRVDDVCKKLGVSRTTLWRLRHTPNFPKPIDLGTRGSGFIEHEIDTWLEDKAEARTPCRHQP